VGIDLASATCWQIVRHNRGQPAGAGLLFVYGLNTAVVPVLSHEVHDAFWFDLQQLSDPQRQITARVSFGGKQLEAPQLTWAAGEDGAVGDHLPLVNQFRDVLESGEERPLPYELPL